MILENFIGLSNFSGMYTCEYNRNQWFKKV
jgi:hypothetical protein